MEIINVTEIITEINNSFTDESFLEEKCIYLSKGISTRQFTIQVLVENLGDLLVNTLVEKRKLGTLILSVVLENLPHDFLSSTELQFICAFYADRFKDNHEVIPGSLKGVRALVKMEHLPENASHKLLSALFDNVPCQQQQFQDRQFIYHIFMEILERRFIEIEAMGLDFVLGVIQAIDGERDPRNLLLLFSWMPKFLQNVKLGHLTEEMFDVISCYFPIDFRTPAQDSSQRVTREDLADALRPCLCALPDFGPFCLPLIIDKLNSSLKIAKYDSLNLLTDSCKIFPPSMYEENSHDIWNLLQREILNSSDADLEESSLTAISAIINRLSTSQNGAFFKRTLENLYDGLKGNLRPDTKLFIASSKVLLAVARASKESCKYLVGKTVSLLLNQISNSVILEEVNQKEIVFKTMMEFVIAYVKLNEVGNIMEVDVVKEVPGLCIRFLENSAEEIRVGSWESLSRIGKTLPWSVRERVYEVMRVKMAMGEGREDVRRAFFKCLKTFAWVYKDEVLKNVLLTEDENSDLSTSGALKFYLEALCAVAPEKSLSPKILPLLLQKCTSAPPVSNTAISTLKKLLEDNSDSDHLQNYLYSEFHAIDKLTEWAQLLIKKNEADFQLLLDVATVIKILVGFQSADEQKTIVRNHVDVLVKNGHVDEGIILLLEGFLERLRPEVEVREKFRLVRELCFLFSTVEQDFFIEACKLIANVLNKCAEDENFLNTLTEIDTFITSNLEKTTEGFQLKNLIHLISWITKSLVIKGSNKSNIWTDKLIALLENHKDVGKSFMLIMDNTHDCLSGRSYCSNRLLYRQKFFAYVCKKLSSSYSCEENTPNHLIAIGYLLQLAPQQVVILYFKEALRLLVFCLELCKDPEVLCAVLNTLCTLIVAKEPYLNNYIDDLLPRFLKLTNFQTSMNVRISSLKCIQEFSSGYPLYLLLPHKQTILFGLTSSLDDKKRLVRRQAVEARSHWFLLDAPT